MSFDPPRPPVVANGHPPRSESRETHLWSEKTPVSQRCLGPQSRSRVSPSAWRWLTTEAKGRVDRIVRGKLQNQRSSNVADAATLRSHRLEAECHYAETRTYYREAVCAPTFIWHPRLGKDDSKRTLGKPDATSSTPSVLPASTTMTSTESSSSESRVRRMRRKAASFHTGITRETICLLCSPPRHEAQGDSFLRSPSIY